MSGKTDIYRVTLDELARDAKEAVITAWHRSPGDTVTKGEDLVEVVTDKASFDVASPCDGVIKSVLRATGSTVAPGEVIAEILISR
jgi:pyruvate/2-oxoglutarate dehydrogenase complex dihydrolipoamide acyltransferase (E2) component